MAFCDDVMMWVPRIQVLSKAQNAKGDCGAETPCVSCSPGKPEPRATRSSGNTKTGLLMATPDLMAQGAPKRLVGLTGLLRYSGAFHAAGMGAPGNTVDWWSGRPDEVHELPRVVPV